eukprot:scaffold2739_cov257-Pinguiococcus_pyrenoidosus.AAC.12
MSAQSRMSSDYIDPSTRTNEECRENTLIRYEAANPSSMRFRGVFAGGSILRMGRVVPSGVKLVSWLPLHSLRTQVRKQLNRATYQRVQKIFAKASFPPGTPPLLRSHNSTSGDSASKTPGRGDVRTPRIGPGTGWTVQPPLGDSFPKSG